MSIEAIIALLGAIGVGGLLGSVLTRWYEQQKQATEHDIKIFNQSNEMLTEQKLTDITNFGLLGKHAIRDDDFFVLTKWCRFFDQIGNHYLNRKIHKANQKLVDSLYQLTDYIGLNFFTIIGQNPNNKFQYLKPDWNPDYADDPSPEKITKYDEYAKELKSLTIKVVQQYTAYRLAIKRSLKI